MSDKQKLTDKERILLLEDQVKFLMKLVAEMQETQSSLLKGFNRFIETKEKNEKELLRWSTAVEERLNKLIVQQANMGLIIKTAIQLTPEQSEQIRQEVEQVKERLKLKKSESGTENVEKKSE